MRMVYCISSIFVLVIVGTGILAYVSGPVRDIPPTPSIEYPEPTAATSSPARSFQFTEKRLAPPGFKGPTAAPHIIGPKSNPPDY